MLLYFKMTYLITYALYNSGRKYTTTLSREILRTLYWQDMSPNEKFILT